MAWPTVVHTWGSTAQERAQPFPCDEVLPNPDAGYFRAVDVDAPPATTWRWLCQLRAAPYSYDLIDNFGRRSPRTLTPGLEKLEPGQRMQTIFKLTSFEDGRSMTMLSKGTLFGAVACTYRVDPRPTDDSRIVVKITVAHAPGIRAPLMRLVLPPGDLVMMRRQLLNLKRLAERQARSG